MSQRDDDILTNGTCLKGSRKTTYNPTHFVLSAAGHEERSKIGQALLTLSFETKKNYWTLVDAGYYDAAQVLLNHA